MRAKQKTTSKPQSKSDRKLRRCLMCRREFESAWAGERICRKCKSTQLWRGG